MALCPAKTQVSLGICPVWSESSLSAWRNLGTLATLWAHSEDSDQTGQMPRLIWVFAGRTLILLVLSCRGSVDFHGLVREIAHYRNNMNQSTTKPTKWHAAQQRLRSAWVSAQSDQSLLCALWVAKDPTFLQADNEDFDQTGWMIKLIWVFARRRGHFVGFIMLGLNYVKNTWRSGQ